MGAQVLPGEALLHPPKKPHPGAATNGSAGSAPARSGNAGAAARRAAHDAASRRAGSPGPPSAAAAAAVCVRGAAVGAVGRALLQRLLEEVEGLAPRATAVALHACAQLGVGARLLPVRCVHGQGLRAQGTALQGALAVCRADAAWRVRGVDVHAAGGLHAARVRRPGARPGAAARDPQ